MASLFSYVSVEIHVPKRYHKKEQRTSVFLPGGAVIENINTSRLFRDDSGAWNWVYRIPMFRNYSILWLILKAVGVCTVGLSVLMGLILSGGRNIRESLLAAGIIFGAVGVIGVVITIVCYFLVAAIYGGCYVAIFSMDEKTIAQFQPVGQAAKNRAIGVFTAMAGAVSGNLALAAASLTTGSRLVVETPFTDIRSLKIIRQKGEIRVHSFLTWYTVYVNPEDYSLIEEHITSRSVNARITYR